MSQELLQYCIIQLQSRPKALNVAQVLDTPSHNYFNRAWSQARFEEQQRSILTLSPDSQDYGRGILWPYELKWSQQPAGGYLLRIERNLLIQPAPRELILLASVSELPIPFENPDGSPIPRHVFRAAKSRMLGGESKRAAGAVAPSLRASVANVQYTCQTTGTYISAVDFPAVVDIEF